ncbi:hypothetical protein SH449x_004694 [Pirellulaceae bacterium SH449]
MKRFLLDSNAVNDLMRRQENVLANYTYARRALELAVAWAYKFDRLLKLPYQDNIAALIHEPTFKQTAGEAVFNKAKVIVKLGNQAVHSHRDIPQLEPR